MSLWVNRIRQLAILAVALFFYSCVDETNLIGFKPPNSKDGKKFIEIQLDSGKVFLSDSVFTTNRFGQGETNRLLVGVYDDAKFGRAKSIAFTQYYPNTTPAEITSTAVFDSLELFLQFDYYSYGSTGTTAERYYIHELTDTISSFYVNYYNNSTIPYNPIPLAIKDTVVSYTYFNAQASKSTGKDTLTIRTKLSDEFGQRIFDFAKNNRADFLNDTTAKVFFKGLAIVPDDANSKIIGFTPSGVAQGSAAPIAYSRMILHYHDDKDTLQFSFVFNGGRKTSFNNIIIDRASSPELSGHPLYTSFTPSDDMLYSQLGDGVNTVLDFGKFYKFAESLKDSAVIIDSGELIIDGVDEVSGLRNISEFYLRVMDNTNRYKTYDGSEQDKTDLLLYRIRPNKFTLSDPAYFNAYAPFTVFNDLNSPAEIPFKTNSYNTYFTLFLQELINKEEGKTRFKNFALVPVSPQRGKAVNRTLINQNNIKLRVFYTVSTVKN